MAEVPFNMVKERMVGSLHSHVLWFIILFMQKDGAAASSLIVSWLEEASAFGNVDVRKEFEDDIRDVAVEAYVGGFETVSCHCIGR